jgi:hypothetical protein
VAYITVRVVGQDGRPRSQARVQIGKDTLLGGMSEVQYTNSEGEAEFRWDHGSPIILYVNGAVAKKNQEVRANFTITV